MLSQGHRETKRGNPNIASGLARGFKQFTKKSLAREASQTQPLLPPLIQLSQNVTARYTCWGFQALSAPASPGWAARRLQTSVTSRLRGQKRLWRSAGHGLLPCKLLAFLASTGNEQGKTERTVSRKRMQSLPSQMHCPQCQTDSGILGKQAWRNLACGTER